MWKSADISSSVCFLRFVIRLSNVLLLQVKAFRLEPGKRVGQPTKGGIVDSDGEVIARGDYADCDSKGENNLMAYGPPIEMTVDKGLVTIFSPRRW